MINPKKLAEMARKWQSIPAKGRKRISFPRMNKLPSLTEKGHFVVYSTDQKRFPIPLEYINSNIFLEPFKMSGEEFGMSNNGPLVMPCYSVFMEYVVSLVQRGAAESLEKALFSSFATSRCSSCDSCQEFQSQCRPTFAY